MSATSSLSGGIFSNRDNTRSVDKPGPTTDATSTTKTDDTKKKPRRKEPQSEPVLDETGNPMFLTLEQAERIVQKILSAEDNESTTSATNTKRDFDSGSVEWQDVGITNPQLLANLKSNKMVCPSPLQVQIKSCPPIIAGNDVLLSTHTGSGKTLAFLAPIAQNIMIHPSNSSLPKAVIVAPGRELASQIVSVAQDLFQGTGLTVALAIGGTSYARNVEMLRTKKPDVVVGTPGRIAELILGRTGDK
jgi:superfamily II DNA/RNA helicase